MAAESDIDIVVRGKDEASSAFAGVGDALDGLRDNTEKTAKGLANIIGTLSGPMAAAGGVTIATATAIGGASLDMAIDMDNAQRNLRDQLSITEEQAAALQPAIESLFVSGLVDSAEEGSEAIAIARQQLKSLSDDELANAANRAMVLSDVFGADYAQTLNSINTLQQQFGLSFNEAADFVAAGFQRGLNNSGDFLDSIGEYSTQFANGDATASQFFSVLETGLSGGMLGTDKAADAFKEFSLRVGDGSKTSAEALEGLGIDANELWAAMSAGEVTTADAFQMVISGLNQIEDPLLRNSIGVGLLGTQYEDLGANSVLALDMSKTGLEELAGSADNVVGQTQTLSQQWESAQREMLVALLPLGEELLNVAQEYMPELREGAAWLAEVLANDLPVAIEWSKDKFGDFQRGVAYVKDIFDDAARGADYLKDQIIGLWDWITSIDDNLPSWLTGGINAAGGFLGGLFAPGGGVSPGGGGGGGWDGGGGGGNSVSVGEINVNGAQDPQATAQAVREELIRVGRMNAGNSDLFGGYA